MVRLLLRSKERTRPEVFCEESVLKKIRKIDRKAPVPGSFFSKGVGLRNATLLKKRLRCGRFSVNFAKFFRTSFSENTCGGCF